MCSVRAAALELLPKLIPGADPQHAQLTAINAVLGRMTAFAYVSTTMGAHNAVEAQTVTKVSAYMTSTVKEHEARAVHNVLVDSTLVVSYVTPAAAKPSAAASLSTMTLIGLRSCLRSPSREIISRRTTRA